jgi:hypothetical protein
MEDYKSREIPLFKVAQIPLQQVQDAARYKLTSAAKAEGK